MQNWILAQTYITPSLNDKILKLSFLKIVLTPLNPPCKKESFFWSHKQCAIKGSEMGHQL